MRPSCTCMAGRRSCRRLIFYALAKHKAKVIVTAHDFFLSCPNGGLINFQSGSVCKHQAAFGCVSRDQLRQAQLLSQALAFPAHADAARRR